MSIIKQIISGGGSDPNATVWVGTWATASDYMVNQQVASNGDLYLCIDEHTSGASTAPGTGADWETVWVRQIDSVNADQLAALAGTEGTPGSSNKYVTNADTRFSYPSTWYWADQSFLAKTVSVAADRYTLLTPNAMQLDIGGTSYALSTQAEIDLSLEATWDTVSGTDYTVAANRAGKDFYVYAVQPVSGAAPEFKVSANSTVPTGYDASNSRKLGGFHCLCLSMSTPGTRANSTAYALDATILSGSNWYRCSTAGTSAASPPTLTTTIGGTTTDGSVTWTCEPIHPASGYLTGDIIPNSVWDLKFRSESGNNQGMTYVAALDIWVDIYLASGTGASTASVKGATISDTRTWLDCVDDGAAVKKRMLRDYEFQIAAAGSNERTNIAGSADPGTTGGHSDTASRRMISNYFLEDCCGALWQWLDEQSTRWDFTTSWNWYALPGSKGSLYNGAGAAGTGDVKLLAGGYWSDAARAGSRARSAYNYRWYTYSTIGCRFAARSITK